MRKIDKILVFSGFSVLLVVAIEIFYVCFLPKMINIEQKLPIVEKIVKEYTEKTLQTENVEIKTYPSFAIKVSAKSINIYNKDKSKFFSANNPSVKIQPLDLIFKTLKIDKLCANNVVLDISDFQDKIYSGKFEKLPELPVNLDASRASIKIENYQILFKDKYLNKNISLKGQKFDLMPASRKLSKLTTDGSWDIDSKICSFNLNIESNFFIKNKPNLEGYFAEGNISNIDLETISPYLNTFTDYKNAKGKIDVKINSVKSKHKDNLTEINVSMKDISINEGNLSRQIVAKGLTTVKARLFASGKVLDFEELKIDNKNFGFLMSGKIQNYQKEIPNLDLKFKILPSKAENVLDIIPHGILKELDVVKDAGVFGDVVGDFSVKGKSPKIEMSGDINASNVHAVRAFKKTHTGKIDMHFVDTKSEINVEVDTPHGAKFLLTGNADVDQSVPSKFDMHTQNGDIPLDMVRAILVPVSQLFNFQLGPVPLFNIKSGTGNAELHITGTREMATINGFVNIINGKATFDGVNANLNNINLRLDFKDKNVGFKTKTATVNGYPASVYGLCTLLGEVNLHIDSNKINANTLKTVVTTSSLTKEMADSLNSLEKLNGNVKFAIFLHGQVDRFSKDLAKEMQKLKIDGYVQMFGNTIQLKGFGMPISSVFGKIDFTESHIKGNNLKIKIGSSPLTASISSTIPKDNKKADLTVSANGNGLNLNDTLNFVSKANLANGISINSIPDLNTRHSLKMTANINGDNIDLRKIFAELKITSANVNKQFFIPTGEILVSGGDVAINKLSLRAEKSTLNMNGKIQKFYAKRPAYDLTINGSNVAVKALCDLANLVPQTKSIIKQFKDISGTVNISLKATDRGLSGYTDFRNLHFRHIKSDVPVSFSYLPIKITNKMINLKNVVGEVGRTGATPIFSNITIENYQKVPIIKGTIAAKPTTLFVERYVNTKLSHPVKLTGDIGINVNVSGSVDSLGIYPTIKINKDSDISYLSANLGDSDVLREITGEMFLKPKNLQIKKLDYIKYPTANDGKKHAVPMWTMNGIFKKSKNIYLPQNVNFTTHQDLPAKMLNFVFKKSLIKSGTFNCILRLHNNGKTSKIIGVSNISNAEIPIYNLKIKNGKLSADEKHINLKADGDLVSTKYQIQTQIDNSSALPVKIKNVEIKTQYLNLARLISVINQWSIDSYKDSKLKTAVSTIKVSDILIEKGVLAVKSIDFRSCPIEDFKAVFSLDKNSILKIDTDSFKITNGNAFGSITYNIKNGETKSNVRMKGVDSNVIASSFLGLKNQITGKLDGNANITTIGLNDRDRLKNTNGIIGFHMEDGTIPKLGSIEYLLRASTLLRSGLTSLSVNNFIELLKPFKTGTFSKISGCLYLKNGILEDIAVFSQGENLSLYLTGDYDIGESESHTIVYGKLGKKTEGLLGPVGNLSASTLFALIPRSDNVTEYEKEISKIPDIEYKNQDVRIFRATVDGDINIDRVSTSFKWIK